MKLKRSKPLFAEIQAVRPAFGIPEWTSSVGIVLSREWQEARPTPRIDPHAARWIYEVQLGISPNFFEIWIPECELQRR